MRTKRISENKELVFDEIIIKNLIDEIIKNCSVTKRETVSIQATSVEDAQQKINSIKNNNGENIYINARLIKSTETDYIFECDKLTQPELVNFLENLLNENHIDYAWFVCRKELAQKEKLQKEIEQIDSKINETSNFEIQRKIDMLNELAKKLNELSKNKAYYDLLSKYYDLAESRIIVRRTHEISLNNDNKKTVYKLIYDEKRIKDLIEEIEQKCSVITYNCHSRVLASSIEEAQKKVNRWNERFEHSYENARDFTTTPYSYDSRYGQWYYDFTYDKKVKPELVNFLKELLTNIIDGNSYNWFITKEEFHSKDLLKSSIEETKKELNNINPWNPTKKTTISEKLNRLSRELHEFPEFNYELLSKYYDQAASLIKPELVYEIAKKEKHPKDKRTHIKLKQIPKNTFRINN